MTLRTDSSSAGSGSDAATNGSQTREGPPDEYFEPRWYALYTRARHEKRVAEQLNRKSVETMVPLYETVRRWRNGRHRVQFPLFPGYAFVHIALKDRLEAVKVPGAVRLVGFEGKPVALPDEEVEGLRRGLAEGIEVRPHPYLTAGRRVCVVSGPLRGMRGILLRRKSHCRLVVSLDLIMRSMIADVDIADVRPELGNLRG